MFLFRFIAHILDMLLMNFKFYRRFVGGFYELWHTDHPYTRIWFRVIEKNSKGRPDIGCRGVPHPEYYPIRKWTHLFSHTDNGLETFRRDLLGVYHK